MRFGLRYCNTGRYVDGRKAVELVQAAEEAGFESAWTVEHTVVPEGHASQYPYSPDGRMAGGAFDFPLPDPLIWMAYVAAHTHTIKLGTGILILAQHSPVVTAKQVATLDVLCGGRVLLGIGVGWLKEEFDAIGASFHDRAARTDEYVCCAAGVVVAGTALVSRRVHPLRRCLLSAAAGERLGADPRRRPLQGRGKARRPARRRFLSC